MNLQVTPHRTIPDQSEQGSSRSPVRFLVGSALLVAILGGYYFYTHMSDGNAGRAGRNAAAPVKVALVEQRDMQVVEHTIGTVVANSVVSVTARVQGQLTSVHFKEGQLVKKGDLLFEIDPAPYQAAYDSAQAVLLGAKTNADRSASLLKQNAIAPQANDNAQATYLQAKANMEAARLNLDFTQIRSPIDGKTGPILLQPGNLVSVNGTTTPLVTITQILPIKVSFALPQADLPRIQARARGKGLNAEINLHDAGGGADLSAPVDFISNAVNATSGTIELRATFPNTDSALVPGQLVDVVVELSDIPQAVVVPRDAVNDGEEGKFVYVVTPDKIAQVHNVAVIFDDGTDVAIQGDLHQGDRVIVDGQLRVIPGAAVNISRAQGGTDAGGRAGRSGGKGGRRGGRRANENAEGSPPPG
jgi:multidrug efflux system membrane fusion protein